MANSEQVLNAVNNLTAKLYGENGFEGDIPEMKESLRNLTDQVRENTQRSLQNANDIKWIKRLGGGAVTSLATIIGIFKGTGL